MYAAIAPLLSQKLSGFLKGYSCSPAFLKMTEDGHVSLDAKDSVAVVASAKHLIVSITTSCWLN